MKNIKVLRGVIVAVFPLVFGLLWGRFPGRKTIVISESGKYFC
jgi:hypothetical protein